MARSFLPMLHLFAGRLKERHGILEGEERPPSASSVSLISLGLVFRMARACKGLQAETQENKKARLSGGPVNGSSGGLVKPRIRPFLSALQLVPIVLKERLKGLP